MNKNLEELHDIVSRHTDAATTGKIMDEVVNVLGYQYVYFAAKSYRVEIVCSEARSYMLASGQSAYRTAVRYEKQTGVSRKTILKRLKS